MATDYEIAWAAGLFEGEGSIEISGHNRSRTGVRLRLNMTDQDIVDRFALIAGCGTVHPVNAPSMAKPHWKKQWKWNIAQASECQRLLELWLPYLGTRRTKRANEALALLLAKEELRHKVCFCGKPFRAIRITQNYCCHDHQLLWVKVRSRCA